MPWSTARSSISRQAAAAPARPPASACARRLRRRRFRTRVGPAAAGRSRTSTASAHQQAGQVRRPGPVAAAGGGRARRSAPQRRRRPSGIASSGRAAPGGALPETAGRRGGRRGVGEALLAALAAAERGGVELHPAGLVEQHLDPGVRVVAADHVVAVGVLGALGEADGHPGRYPDRAQHDRHRGGVLLAVPLLVVQEVDQQVAAVPGRHVQRVGEPVGRIGEVLYSRRPPCRRPSWRRRSPAARPATTSAGRSPVSVSVPPGVTVSARSSSRIGCRERGRDLVRSGRDGVCPVHRLQRRVVGPAVADPAERGGAVVDRQELVPVVHRRHGDLRLVGAAARRPAAARRSGRPPTSPGRVHFCRPTVRRYCGARQPGDPQHLHRVAALQVALQGGERGQSDAGAGARRRPWQPAGGADAGTEPATSSAITVAIEASADAGDHLRDARRRHRAGGRSARWRSAGSRTAWPAPRTPPRAASSGRWRPAPSTRTAAAGRPAPAPGTPRSGCPRSTP